MYLLSIIASRSASKSKKNRSQASTQSMKSISEEPATAVEVSASNEESVDKSGAADGETTDAPPGGNAAEVSSDEYDTDFEAEREAMIESRYINK